MDLQTHKNKVDDSIIASFQDCRPHENADPEHLQKEFESCSFKLNPLAEPFVVGIQVGQV